MNSNEILSKILIKYKALCGNKYQTASIFLSNNKGDSFYSIQKRNKEKPVQIRLSNHGTFLKTWVDREALSDSKTRLLDPSQCINISIVFVEDGENLTQQCIGQQTCDNCTITPCCPQTFKGQNELGKPFVVKQYVYKSNTINAKYLDGIVKAIMEARFRGSYIDPLQSTERQSSEKELSSQYNTQQPQQPIQENNNKYTNKNIMKINESQLRKIIQESIKNVLNEGFRTLKPYSQEWKDTFGNPEYEDFEDWETDADKYNTYYQYDKDLPTKLEGINELTKFVHKTAIECADTANLVPSLFRQFGTDDLHYASSSYGADFSAATKVESIGQSMQETACI